MEATPADIDVEAVLAAILKVEGVRGVHDLHIWSITRGLPTLSAHILVDDIPLREGTKIQAAVSETLDQTFGISHATLQLECEGCLPAGLYCDISANMNNH
jgi:cobalt-zinc-cadmium efflux system protein